MGHPPIRLHLRLNLKMKILTTNIIQPKVPLDWSYLECIRALIRNQRERDTDTELSEGN